VIASTRRPSFLSRTAPTAEARPVKFGQRTIHGGIPAEPPAPTPAEIEAIRADALARVAHAVEVLKLQSARLAEQARSDALEIGFQVARRILEAEVKADPGTVIALAKSAMRRAGESRKIVVRAHPEDIATLEGAAEAGDLQVGVATVEIQPDPGLARGDVLVDTDFGRVDGRLRTRLDELHRGASLAVGEGAA
jgi:flagellar assembly protein FliH